MPLVEELRADMLGMWLPAAMATVVQAVYASRGARPPEARDLYGAWGLAALVRQCDEQRDDLTEQTIAMLEGD